jgi:hypothetical protein
VSAQLWTPLALVPGRACRPPGYPAPVHWMFTGLLIGASGATAVYTLWLVRRLFTTAPAAAPAPDAEVAP